MLLHSGKKTKEDSMSEIPDWIKLWLKESHKGEDDQSYEELIKDFTEKKQWVEIRSKTKKLVDMDDIEAYLTTFEKAAEAHGVEKEKWSVIIAPRHSTTAMLSNDDSKNYNNVKE